MAHYCECHRRIVIKARARHARGGWIYRPGHDLCRKCWRSLVARHAIRCMKLAGGRLSLVRGLDPNTEPRGFSLAFLVLGYRAGEARAN